MCCALLFFHVADSRVCPCTTTLTPCTPQDVSRVDLEMKAKMSSFNKAKSNLSALQRKAK